MGSVPSTFATGYKYIGLGYTTAFDAAVPPLMARHAHEEFEDTPCIDKGFYVLMGNNHYVMQAIQEQRARTAEGLRRLAAGGGQRLCRQAGQSRRRRGLEAPRRRQRAHGGRAGRPLRRHAAADHPRSWPQAVDELRLPHSGPHPLQQPGPARQLADHAGNDEGPGRAPRAHDAHPVPQLRRRRRRREHVQLEGRPAGRLRQRSTPTSRSTSARCCSAKRPA